MSRCYRMEVRVWGFKLAHASEIDDAMSKEWRFEDSHYENEPGPSITLCGEDSLCGGETEEQFTDRISAVVWDANQGFCSVEVYATYLEDLPCEVHKRGIEHYTKYAADKKMDEGESSYEERDVDSSLTQEDHDV